MCILSNPPISVLMEHFVLFFTLCSVCASHPQSHPGLVTSDSMQRTKRTKLTRETLFYKVSEELPRGTPIGNVVTDFAKLLPDRETQILSGKLKVDLTITNWRDRSVQLFSLDSGTGYLRVVVPPDRETICPPGNNLNLIKDNELVESHDPTHLANSNVFTADTPSYIKGAEGNDAPCLFDIKLAYTIRELSSDSSSGKRERLEDPGLLTVRIEIEDINDHAPTFPQSRLMLELGEVSAIPETTTIELPTAFDPDRGINGSIAYWLGDSSQETRGNTQYNIAHGLLSSATDTRHSLPFRLEGNPLRLVLTKELDWETVKEYNLVVYAQDYGLPKSRVGQLNIHITVRDENDNAPEFLQSEYSAVINESVHRGAIILELSAKDADSSSNGQLTFSLSQPLNANEKVAMQFFGIRTISAQQAAIYVILTPDVDGLRQQQPPATGGAERFADQTDANGHASQHFVFYAMVRDNGYPRQLSSRAKVTITVLDVNDMAPTIFISYLNTPKLGSQERGQAFSPVSNERNRGLVTENVPRAFVAFVTVQDYDSGAWGQVQCYTTNDAFALLPVSNGNTDAGTSFNLEHFAPTNHARTARSTSGEVGFKLLAIKPFDREKTSEVSFYIRCVDNPTLSSQKYADNAGLITNSPQSNYHSYSEYTPSAQLTGTALVRVLIADENDNAPQFSKNQYLFIVNEADGSTSQSSGKNQFIGQVFASDPDQSSHVTYAIDEKSSNSFSIEPATGKIYSKQQFDRENIVKTLRSADSNIVYGIKATIEGDENVYLNLPVIATDGYHNITTNVRLLIQDVNDNPPVFTMSQYEFHVPENDQPAQSGSIGVIQAHDDDIGQNAQIVYRLLDITDSPTTGQSNQSFFELHQRSVRSFFTISSKSGQLHLIRKLDREQQSHHIFYVLAIDNPPDGRTLVTWKTHDPASSHSTVSHTATATVTIIVEDVNDNTPKITYPPSHGIVNVESGAPAGHNLFTVVAEDPDAGENGTVHFSLHLVTFDRNNLNSGNSSSQLSASESTTLSFQPNSGLFSIDPTTGLVFLVEKLVNQTANYLLVIEAQDMGRPTQRKVTSTVTVRVQSRQILNALSAFRHGEANVLDQQLTDRNHLRPQGLGNDVQSAENAMPRHSLSLPSYSEQNNTPQTRRKNRNDVSSDSEPSFQSGNRSRLLPFTDRTIVVILATIFTLLLLITIVLVLLIKRRRDLDHQVAIQKDKYDCPKSNNNSTKLEMMRPSSQSRKSPIGPDGTYPLNGSRTEFSTIPRIQPVLLHEGQFVELDSDYTRSIPENNVYPERLDTFKSQNDYQRVIPSHFLNSTLSGMTRGSQNDSRSETSERCLSSSLELLNSHGQPAGNGAVARQAPQHTVCSEADKEHRPKISAHGARNNIRYQTIDLLLEPNEFTRCLPLSPTQKPHYQQHHVKNYCFSSDNGVNTGSRAELQKTFPRNLQGTHSEQVPDNIDKCQAADLSPIQSNKLQLPSLLDNLELKQILISTEHPTNNSGQQNLSAETDERHVRYTFEDSGCVERQGAKLKLETKNSAQAKGVSFV